VLLGRFGQSARLETTLCPYLRFESRIFLPAPSLGGPSPPSPGSGTGQQPHLQPRRPVSHQLVHPLPDFLRSLSSPPVTASRSARAARGRPSAQANAACGTLGSCGGAESPPLSGGCRARRCQPWSRTLCLGAGGPCPHTRVCTLLLQ